MDKNMSGDQGKTIGIRAMQAQYGMNDAEAAVLSCFIDDISNAQIAHRLGISESMVEAHLTSIVNKIIRHAMQAETQRGPQ